jgi:tetratricopeptide (TPR) repeat protein
VADVFTEWPDARGNAAVIAHHFAEAGAAAEAAHWAIFAADDALRQLAHDNALAIASRALALVDAEATPDLKARAELLLLIGRAQSDNVQLTQRAEIVWSAVDDARRVGATELIARAAIVLDEWTSDTNELDDRWVALAEECVEVLGVDAPALRSELLARLAWGIVASGRDPDRGAPLADAAVELARSTGDVTPQVIGACVHAVSCFGTGDAARRLDLTLHAQRIYNGPPSNTSWLVRRLLIPIRLELGDRAGFREEVEAFRAELRGLRLLPASAFLTSYDVLDAFLDGRLDAAAAGVDEVGKAAAETGWPPLVAIWTGQLYWLHRERGTAADLAPVLAAAVEENPTIIGFRGALALTLAEAGALDAAASHIERLHDLEARDLVGDATASVALSQLAEAAVRVGDRKAAARFYDLLLPHRGHLLVVGWGVICSGAADRYLGMLASLLGGTAAAVDHYEAALELEQRVDAPALVARTRYALGALRRDRNVLAEVAETAVSLGMTGLAREATDAALLT